MQEATSKTVVLTGFPGGFLARRVLYKLLQEEPATRVRCLVPDRYMDSAELVLAALPEGQQARVEVVRGDPTAMDFGLSGKRFAALANETDVIHHCTALTHAGTARDIAERINVGATAEVLELAEAAPSLQRLVYWSSALVSGRRQGRVLETELAKPHGFRSVIEETRFRAERMVREAMEHLPTTILRPSNIVGDSRTGEIDRLEGPYLLITLMLGSPMDLRVPLPGRGDVPLNLVPIDYVVDAGYTLSKDPRAVGGTFHLVDDHPLSARRVFELIASATGRPGPVGTMPTRMATALLRTPGLERFSHIPRAFIEQLATAVVYDSRGTQELLAGTGITCPSAADYLAVMVDHVKAEQQRRADQRKPPEESLDEVDDPLG